MDGVAYKQHHVLYVRLSSNFPLFEKNNYLIEIYFGARTYSASYLFIYLSS